VIRTPPLRPSFKTEEEAQAHMDVGDHVKELESMSAYDNIRKKWADRVVVSHMHIQRARGEGGGELDPVLDRYGPPGG